MKALNPLAFTIVNGSRVSLILNVYMYYLSFKRRKIEGPALVNCWQPSEKLGSGIPFIDF